MAAGPIDAVLRDEILTRAFGVPIIVERRDGRAWARMSTSDAHDASGEPVSLVTRMSLQTMMMRP